MLFCLKFCPELFTILGNHVSDSKTLLMVFESSSQDAWTSCIIKSSYSQ